MLQEKICFFERLKGQTYESVEKKLCHVRVEIVNPQNIPLLEV